MGYPTHTMPIIISFMYWPICNCLKNEQCVGALSHDMNTWDGLFTFFVGFLGLWLQLNRPVMAHQKTHSQERGQFFQRNYVGNTQAASFAADRRNQFNISRKTSTRFHPEPNHSWFKHVYVTKYSRPPFFLMRKFVDMRWFCVMLLDWMRIPDSNWVTTLKWIYFLYKSET